MNKKKEQNVALSEEKRRLGAVGGQAVLEGVMMKTENKYSIAVRMEDGSIKITDRAFHSVRRKVKFFNLPILRGVVNFVEMMMLSYNTLNISAQALGFDEAEDESKFEKWLREKLGKNIMDVVMVISMVLGLALGFGLFFFLPVWITKTIDSAAGGIGWFKNLIEGLIKIAIFVGYIWLVSFMKDIRRTFEYHGAEHKSVFCYEAGDELTPENVRKYSRFHPRCGTSFMFVMLALSILVNSLPFVTWENMALRVLTKVLILPIIVGVGYEFIRYAGKHDNIFVKIVSAPGLWMQRLTTREPDDSQIEIAIAALTSALYKEPEPIAVTEDADDNDAARIQTDH